MDLWVNTFGLSKALKKDFDGTLARLKAAGVNGVEPCIVFSSAFGRVYHAFCRCGFALAGLDGGNWFGRDAYSRTERVIKAGLKVPSVHCALANASPAVLGRLIDPALAYAERFGLQYIVVSLEAASVAKAAPFADALARFAVTAAERGISVLYHNHAAEFADGALKYLLGLTPALGLELDVGWAVWAGRDPAALVRAYADRLKILHLKDVRVGKKGKERFAAVGEGDLPLAETLRAARELPSPLPQVIDQDAGRDIVADVARGAANIRRLL